MKKTTENNINLPFLIISIMVCSAFILGFTFVLRFTLRKTTPLSIQNFTVNTPENFSNEFIVQETADSFTISGYAVVLGQKFLTVNTHVVLYNQQENVYISIPTTMDFSGATPVPNDEGQYYFGKFTSVVTKKQLSLPPENYQLGILYQSNDYNNLILTQKKLIG